MATLQSTWKWKKFNVAKLTLGVNFINVLQAPFTHADTKSAKNTVKSSLKAARQALVKLNLRVDFINICFLQEDAKLYSAHAHGEQIWQTEEKRKEEKFSISSDAKLLVKLNGELFAKRCSPTNSCLANKC